MTIPQIFDCCFCTTKISTKFDLFKNHSSEHDDDYNLFKEKLMARIPKISTPLGNIPLAHDG